MENIFKNSQNNGMVKANSTRSFLGLFQKQYETGLGNRGKQLLNKVVNNTGNRGLDTNKYPMGDKSRLASMSTGENINSTPPQPPF